MSQNKRFNTLYVIIIIPLLIGLSILVHQLINLQHLIEKNHALNYALIHAKNRLIKTKKTQQWWQKNKLIIHMWQLNYNHQLEHILRQAHTLQLKKIIKKNNNDSAPTIKDIQISWAGTFKQTLMYLRYLSQPSNPWPIKNIRWSKQNDQSMLLTIEFEVPHVD